MRVLAVVFAPLMVLLLVATGSAFGAMTRSEAAQKCGAGELGNSVRAEFKLSKATEFAASFAEGFGAPELDVSAPATVVVFNDPYIFFRTGTAYRSVVCVVINGVPNVYPDVPLIDAKFE